MGEGVYQRGKSRGGVLISKFPAFAFLISHKVGLRGSTNKLLVNVIVVVVDVPLIKGVKYLPFYFQSL